MSQLQINEMLKKMLDFGRNSADNQALGKIVEDVKVSAEDDQTNVQPESESKKPIHDLETDTKKPENTNISLSRKQKRENQRKEERIKKAKTKKIIEKPTLSQLKEIVRKNTFDKDDRIRIERVLYNSSENKL